MESELVHRKVLNQEGESQQSKSDTNPPTGVVLSKTDPPISTPDQPKTVKPVPQTLLQKTIIRSIVGIVMMAFFYGILHLPHKYISVLIILGQMITWNEVVSLRYKLKKEKDLKLFRTINWYFLVVSFFFFYGKHAIVFIIKSDFHPVITRIARLCHDFSLPIIFTLYVAGFVAFILSLRGDSLRYQFSQITWTFLTLWVVIGQTHFSMQYLYDGLVWILLPHGLIIVNDIMAYFFGISLGRKIINRPLFELSPNKTWEGFIGAMFGTVLVAFFVSPLFIQSDWLICPAGLYNPETGCDLRSFNHGFVFVPVLYRVPSYLLDVGITATKQFTLYPLQIHAVIFALFASLIAPFGGFLASSIKRAFNRKDFDTIFPGHGGFMDRVDCQLLMCSFVYIYVTTFIKTDVSVVDTIAAQFEILSKEQQLELLQRFQDRLSL